MATKEAGFVNLSVRPSTREKLRTLHLLCVEDIPMWELLDRLIEQELQRKSK